MIAKFVYQIITYAELIRELWRNSSLRQLVGLDSVGGMPRNYHFSRLLKRLASDEGLALLDEMFHQLVSDLGAQLPDFGQHLAVDATAVHAYSNEMRRDKSDLDAAWSARPKRQRRRGPAGKVEQYTDYWFGYLVHLVVDCETELPLGYEVTAANVNETTRFRPLLEAVQAKHPQLIERTEAVAADAGYDSGDNCAHVLREVEALPIIKMRLTQPKAKRDAIFGAAICPCNELGTPLCASGHKMVYWGRDGDYLKWRCPAKCGRAECTQRGRWIGFGRRFAWRREGLRGSKLDISWGEKRLLSDDRGERGRSRGRGSGLGAVRTRLDRGAKATTYAPAAPRAQTRGYRKRLKM